MKHILLVAILLVGVSRCVNAAEAVSFPDEIRPLLTTYCYKCHNPDKSKGGLDLTKIQTDEQVKKSFDLLQILKTRIDAHEMPPEFADQPTEEERAKLLHFIETLQPAREECNKIATDETQEWFRGEVMARRLTREEYERCVSDLFGMEIGIADHFPAEGSGGEGFNTTGSTMFTSTLMIEKYMDAAEQVLTQALPENEIPPPPQPLLAARRLFTPAADAPSTQSQLSTARDRIFFAYPNEQVRARRAARLVLTDFARRAFRRPVTQDEIDTLLKMFDRRWERGDDFDTSVKLALKAVLVSPHFLFVVETGEVEEEIFRLDHYEIATRLALLFWSSIPDEELMILAQNEMLHDETVVRDQIQRMMRDPKARALGENFGMQWLDLGKFNGSAKPDPKVFPEWDDQLAGLMREETILLFQDIVSADRSVLDLIDADFTYLNDTLAQHYGIEGVEGPEMRRVEVAAAGRGGVLSLGSVLTATSHPNRTSPVVRGQWVLEQILGERIPPPPPNVGELPESGEGPEATTLRERLAVHRENPECASCHQKMDPIGFGLENFDAIGRWRTLDHGQPIDSTGTLPSGESFEGPDQLKQIILKDKKKFARHLTRKLLGYALGRKLNRFDECVIDDGVEALEQNDYRISALLETIILSYPYQHRYNKQST